jgi:hypothetical protein
MTDDPLFNDDDIYFDELIWPEPLKGESIHAKINAPTIRSEFPIQPEDSDTVTVDRALLVRLARFVYTMEPAVTYRTKDLNELIVVCEQIIREHGG